MGGRGGAETTRHLCIYQWARRLVQTSLANGGEGSSEKSERDFGAGGGRGKDVFTADMLDAWGFPNGEVLTGFFRERIMCLRFKRAP